VVRHRWELVDGENSGRYEACGVFMVAILYDGSAEARIFSMK
jgi:hypothetical protein